jgi:cleavage stimulation factor subunit 3
VTTDTPLDSPAITTAKPHLPPAYTAKSGTEAALLERSPWDLDAWNRWVVDVKRQNDLDALRGAYEALLKQFPTSVRPLLRFHLTIKAKHWIQFVEMEISAQQYDQVQAIFSRCLTAVPHVDLWKTYLDFIRRINSGPSGKETPEGRPVITEAFEFALFHIGMDVDSTPIWQEYIQFIKSWPVRFLLFFMVFIHSQGCVADGGGIAHGCRASNISSRNHNARAKYRGAVERVRFV